MPEIVGSNPVNERIGWDYSDVRALQDDRTKVYPVLTQAAGKSWITVAEEAWALNLPEDAQIEWVLGPNEEHCSDCPRLAAEGPYSRLTLPTYPGAGATECMVNCKCYLQTSDGMTSFDMEAVRWMTTPWLRSAARCRRLPWPEGGMMVVPSVKDHTFHLCDSEAGTETERDLGDGISAIWAVPCKDDAQADGP